MIFAGGCRTVSEDGFAEDNNCNTCLRQGICDMEPRARELAGLMSEQWVSTDDKLPPDMEPILYLEYSSEESAGTVHYGCYDRKEKAYREWPSGKSLSEESVIAWMLVPVVPARVYRNRASIFQQL